MISSKRAKRIAFRNMENDVQEELDAVNRAIKARAKQGFFKIRLHTVSGAAEEALKIQGYRVQTDYWCDSDGKIKADIVISWE